MIDEKELEFLLKELKVIETTLYTSIKRESKKDPLSKKFSKPFSFPFTYPTKRLRSLPKTQTTSFVPSLATTETEMPPLPNLSQPLSLTSQPPIDLSEKTPLEAVATLSSLLPELQTLSEEKKVVALKERIREIATSLPFSEDFTIYSSLSQKRHKKTTCQTIRHHQASLSGLSR